MVKWARYFESGVSELGVPGMSQYGSWSVKGVDDRARAIAKEKARLRGVTLGDYINNLLLDGHSEAGPRDSQLYAELQRPSGYLEQNRVNPLDSLAQRIEAVEARSTLAITGIDQSVLGLLARLESSDNSSAAMAAEVERMVDELRETQELLREKVGVLESDQSGQQNLEALKSLEEALSNLANHVHDENRMAQDESSAIKGRMEAGFSEVSDRVEGMEIKVESTLTDAAKRVEEAVQQAEQRSEGTARLLSERIASLESDIASKFSHVGDVESRVQSVEADVSGAITSMESTIERIQDRLHRAETTTDSALKALEGTFANLDQRIDHVADLASPDKAAEMRQELEQRIDTLAQDLRTSIEQSRRHLADEIERAAAGANPELMGVLETRMNALEAENFGERFEQVNEQLNHMSDTLVRHVEDSENRSAAAIEQVGEQVAGLSDSLQQRLSESDGRNASAIEQVGEQVATAIKQIQARQKQNTDQLEEKFASAEAKQEARLSEALTNISDRLTDMKSQTVGAFSPVQRAILSLAGRLEALEDYNAPPTSEPLEGSADDDLVESQSASEPIDDDDAFASPYEDENQSDGLIEAETTERESQPIEQVSFDDEPVELESSESETDFIEGLPDFDEETVQADAADLDFDSLDSEPEADDDILEPPTGDDDSHIFDASAEETEDPLAELGSWEDSQEEARDSDIFGEEETNPALADLSPAFDEDELAHNTQDLEDDGASSDLDDLLEPEPETEDYLNRARDAAIAASDSPRSNKKAARNVKAAPSSSFMSSGKLPIIAAASVFALSAAGAGAWVALRGKTPFVEHEAPTIATKADISMDPAVAESEPSLQGVEFKEDEVTSLDETLFEEEGSVAGTVETVAAPTVKSANPVELPLIPAVATLETAAANGDPVAEYLWGKSRLEAQDYAAGSDYIARSAQQGVVAAQYRMAKLHERGIGVPRDFAEARAWTKRAANGGNVKAMHDLAVFFADGEGGTQSYAAAAEWFRKAADYGVVDSQYNLAVLYENGLGISPSQSEALYWYKIAAANGDAGAPSNVSTLENALPQNQVEDIQQRASAWTLTPSNPSANGEFGEQAWDRASLTQVSAVQTVLNGLGYNAGSADGLLGNGTRSAIRAFQSDKGMEPTGILDEPLVDALNAHSQAFAG